MTTLYGSAQAGLSEHTAKTERKYYLMSGGKFLFWDASKLTDKRSQAWSGTEYQAGNCRRDYPAARGCKPVPTTSIIPTPLNEEAV